MLDERAWRIPPGFRRFPEEMREVYEAEDTPLDDILDLWVWKHDLVTYSDRGPRPDDGRIVAQLADEARAFMVGTGDEGQEA